MINQELELIHRQIWKVHGIAALGLELGHFLEALNRIHDLFGHRRGWHLMMRPLFGKRLIEHQGDRHGQGG